MDNPDIVLFKQILLFVSQSLNQHMISTQQTYQFSPICTDNGLSISPHYCNTLIKNVLCLVDYFSVVTMLIAIVFYIVGKPLQFCPTCKDHAFVG